MDILSTFQYNDFNDFNITIGEIRNGWMNITLTTKEKQLDYWASYICDPLNDLLEATVLLLTKSPKIIYGNTYFTKEKIIAKETRRNELVTHDTEGDYIEWLLRYSDNIFTVIIWKNIFTDLLDTLCFYDFDSKKYEENECEEMPNLIDNLEFAFKGEPIFFAQKLILILKELELKNTVDKYEHKTEWGYRYSEENFTKLTEWIKNNQT